MPARIQRRNDNTDIRVLTPHAARILYRQVTLTDKAQTTTDGEILSALMLETEGMAGSSCCKSSS